MFQMEFHQRVEYKKAMSDHHRSFTAAYKNHPSNIQGVLFNIPPPT